MSVPATTMMSTVVNVIEPHPVRLRRRYYYFLTLPNQSMIVSQCFVDFNMVALQAHVKLTELSTILLTPLQAYMI